MNRQLHFAEEFQNAKQNEKQIAQIFDNHLSYLKTQLHSFAKKQRRMNFFIRLKFALKFALTTFQTISDRTKNLITLTIKLKINIKRHDDVITTSNDCLKSFKNVRRKFFKKKKKFSLQMRNLNVKKKVKKKSFPEITCYICEKRKHYTSNCFRFSKNAKIKTDVNVVETTTKKFANFQKQQTNK